eukprot:TRINITY_DN303_c0_g1_i3.p1 TRINITY_DN303_c0_g1~~TRINITY_DN303_c0_g1_i3.p1  ORF type:complete len:293 (+),score=61.95 TRINITY_DN303_c0_g1_i3:508-1386(+)
MNEWDKTLNAFLNSKHIPKGTLHIGVAKSSCRIENGIVLTEQDKKDIRDRVASILGSFYPQVSESLWEVDFIRCTNSENCYRIDVNVYPGEQRVYQMSHVHEVVFHRTGAQTDSLTLLDIYKRVVTAENSVFLDVLFIKDIREFRRRMNNANDADTAIKIIYDMRDHIDLYQDNLGVSVAMELLDVLLKTAWKWGDAWFTADAARYQEFMTVVPYIADYAIYIRDVSGDTLSLEGWKTLTQIGYYSRRLSEQFQADVCVSSFQRSCDSGFGDGHGVTSSPPGGVQERVRTQV